MAESVTYSNHYLYQLAKKLIDLSADSIKVLLMKPGFVFDKQLHHKLINIKTDSGSLSISFVASTKKITRGSGSFITDGFVAGNIITTDATLNPGPFTIVTVAALEIVVSETVVDEGPVTKTVTSDQELDTGSGYTQNTKTTGTVTLTEDNVNDRAEATYPTVTWDASGGAIGPSPGAILYDDTTADNTIIQYIDFDGDQTATDGFPFNLSGGHLRITH